MSDPVLDMIVALEARAKEDPSLIPSLVKALMGSAATLVGSATYSKSQNKEDWVANTIHGMLQESVVITPQTLLGCELDMEADLQLNIEHRVQH